MRLERREQAAERHSGSASQFDHPRNLVVPRRSRGACARLRARARRDSGTSSGSAVAAHRDRATPDPRATQSWPSSRMGREGVDRDERQLAFVGSPSYSAPAVRRIRRAVSSHASPIVSVSMGPLAREPHGHSGRSRRTASPAVHTGEDQHEPDERSGADALVEEDRAVAERHRRGECVTSAA